MDQGVAAIIGATIVGCITIIASIITVTDNNRRKRDELFFKALDFLEGGTQKRNLGIAALELSLKSKKHRPLCVSLLIGSAIYLLTESKQKDAEHERNNLSRIMSLLLKPKSINLSKKNNLLRENYIRLKQIIAEAKTIADEAQKDKKAVDTTKQIQDIYKAEEQLHKIVKDSKEPDNSKGLYVEPDELKRWEKELNIN